MTRKLFGFSRAILFLCCAEVQSGNVNQSIMVDSGSSRFVPPPPPFAPSILFPVGSATGILVAFAIPIAPLDRSVFMSYNFEANYGMPTRPSETILGPLNRVNSHFVYLYVLENTVKAFSYNSTSLILQL